MLGGIAPLLIFTIAPDDPFASAQTLTGLPQLQASILGVAGIPIPIYLDENLTGIMVDNEDKALNFETQPQQRQDSKTPVINQRGIQSDTTINLSAKKTSIILTALLALAEQCFLKAVSKKYSVSYFNGPTTLINGLMKSFVVHADPNSELLTIQMVLTKAGDETKFGVSQVPITPAATGPVPIVGGS